jgi:signal transduction histidine kinase
MRVLQGGHDVPHDREALRPAHRKGEPIARVRIFGVDPAVAPSRELVLERTHPDDAALVEEQVGRAERERAPLDFQHRLVVPDRAIKHVRWVAQVMEEGGDLELVGAISDITALKRSEMAEAALADADDVIQRIRSLVKKSSPQRDALDLNQAIRDVATLTRREVEQSGVALVLQLGPGLPKVIADRVQLQQVILNLVVNAVEAMRDQKERREIRITSVADEHALRVSVADSGPGLHPGTADRVFDAFFSRKPDGMGMGLAISRSIVESHGGRVWTSANDPRGAVFHFSLPAMR